MARGWESKDVESQVEQAEAERRAAQRQTPTAADLQRESLLLTRARVVRDLDAARHPRHRAQLEAALQHLDGEIARLGGSEQQL
ncbi:MAG: hypothetical protein FJW39_30590 [Acidobacteria bacterium]|nr:hypothetical protein [Acidobacteriota bacterium]